MDRGTIIYDIERCTCHVPDACRDCSHYTGTVGFECMEGLMRDALDLLEEQDAEWVYGENETGVDGWYCSECNFFEPWFYEFDDNIDFIKRYEHCPKCGRRMTSYTGKQEGR